MIGYLLAVVVGLCWMGRCGTCPHKTRMAAIKDDVAAMKDDLARLGRALKGGRDE